MEYKGREKERPYGSLLLISARKRKKGVAGKRREGWSSFLFSCLQGGKDCSGESKKRTGLTSFIPLLKGFWEMELPHPLSRG